MNRRNIDYQHRAPIAQTRTFSISKIEHGLDDDVDVNANHGKAHLPQKKTDSELHILFIMMGYCNVIS